MNQTKIRSGYTEGRKLPGPVYLLAVAREHIMPGQALAVCFVDGGMRAYLASGDDLESVHGGR